MYVNKINVGKKYLSILQKGNMYDVSEHIANFFKCDLPYHPATKKNCKNVSMMWYNQKKRQKLQEQNGKIVTK